MDGHRIGFCGQCMPNERVRRGCPHPVTRPDYTGQEHPPAGHMSGHAPCAHHAKALCVALHGYSICPILGQMARCCGKVCCGGGVPATPCFFLRISACCCDANGRMTHPVRLSWANPWFLPSHQSQVRAKGTK